MIEITPRTPGFAADISGVDVRRITADEFKEIHAAWLAYGVLRFRDQQPNEDEFQAFSRRFGPLEEIPFGRLPESEKAKIKNRFVTQLSNIVVDGKPIGGLGNAEAAWHSDMTYAETPPPASLVLAVEIPDEGGDTYFANQYAALEALPKELGNRIAGLTIKHDAGHTSIGELRPGFDHYDDPREAPGATHAIVRTHEETGRRALYLGRRDWAYILGLSLHESEALLDELWTYAALADNVWRQKWRPDDLIIWDNRCVLHRRDEFDQNARRLLKRCQVLSSSEASL